MAMVVMEEPQEVRRPTWGERERPDSEMEEVELELLDRARTHPPLVMEEQEPPALCPERQPHTAVVVEEVALQPPWAVEESVAVARGATSRRAASLQLSQVLLQLVVVVAAAQTLMAVNTEPRGALAS